LTDLRRLYFDSLVYEADALEILVRRVGAEKVLLGGDFPFDMGVSDSPERLDAVTTPDAAEREAIRGHRRRTPEPHNDNEAH
jgi:aminocarboxymuconate-semialdehyde decarboxylase